MPIKENKEITTLTNVIDSLSSIRDEMMIKCSDDISNNGLNRARIFEMGKVDGMSQAIIFICDVVKKMIHNTPVEVFRDEKESK